MYKHLLLALVMLSCVSLSAQSSNPYPWEIGLKVGTASMAGDLIDPDIVILNQPSFGANINVRRRIGKVLALKAHLMYASLESDETEGDNARRGFTSNTSVIEPGLMLEFEPFAAKRFGDDGFKKILSPYVGAGVAYGIWGDVDTDYNGRTNARIAQDIQDQEDDNGGVVIPLGAGLKYYLSEKSSLGLDVTYRMTGSDLIDGVSASANPDDDDAYVLTGLTFSTGFGKKDTDKDGIADEDDACPNEPGPESTMGCPDTDGDGVADKDDRCPQTAGLATLKGCPDGDGDGIADIDDKCPTEAGLAALGGCPDADGDGIADGDDKCPTEAGPRATMGCPDGDGDGIADADDDCPAEAGPRGTNGCPDSDGDGIADKDDECPNEAGPASRNGCPVPKITDRPENLNERIARYRTLLEGQDFSYIRLNEAIGTIDIDRIYFPTDVSRLDRPDRMIIEEIDRFLALPGASNFSIRFEGHADRRASDEYNQALSERRASSAKDYAAEKGASSSKLTMIGFGESRPVGETLRENRVVIPVASEPTQRVNIN
ncbi:DUF6089 family protein [Lewinella sp. 4G2]|uniref:DUF6089 family protein n=1 Tax=Lewinella sp. 4G2 TaxID=1803372 RepID=UPI0007B4C568|nr:DUF6089 family protein [Lewinella sp. 4G2]OAV45973.1 hypothetical protein A3850_018940 [Lewinella sp. 4G2]